MFFHQRSRLDPPSEYVVVLWTIVTLLLIGAVVAGYYAWGAPPDKAAVAAQLRAIGWTFAALGGGLAVLIVVACKLLDI